MRKMQRWNDGRGPDYDITQMLKRLYPTGLPNCCYSWRSVVNALRETFCAQGESLNDYLEKFQ